MTTETMTLNDTFSAPAWGKTKRFACGVWLLAAVLAGVALARTHRRPHAGQPPLRDAAPVASHQPAAAVPAREAAEVAFLGVVLTGDSVQVEPKVEGRISRLLVKPGDKVAEGDIVAELDTRSLQHDLKAQEASASAAAARLRRRIPLSLGRLSAVTPEELDAARYDAVREKQRLKQLQLAVAEGRIMAPFAGTVTEQFLSEGAITGPGRPVFRLLSNSKPRVRFAIPEDQARAIGSGTLITLSIESTKDPVSGVIVSINPEIDSASRLVYAMAELSAPAQVTRTLSNGAIAQVTVAQPGAMQTLDTPAAVEVTFSKL